MDLIYSLYFPHIICKDQTLIYIRIDIHYTRKVKDINILHFFVQFIYAIRALA